MSDTTAQPPRKVALFSGHMIDAIGRGKPRFPPDKEPVAARAIAEALADLGVGPVRPRHLRRRLRRRSPICRGCLARGARLELYLPLDEPTFLNQSVDFADSDWRTRFFAAKARAVVHIAPSELCSIRDGQDAYDRNNRWMLETALGFGADQVDFVCLWNGEGGDGPGGTRDMIKSVRNRGGRTRWLDTTKLWAEDDR